MGLYIFFSTKSKKVKGNALIKARRNHRYTAVVASVFTLMFTFSGCYQAFSELTGPDKQVIAVQHGFSSAAVHLDLNKLHSIVKQHITNIGLIGLDGKSYWQVYLQSGKKSHQIKDLMKDMSTDAAAVTYVNAADYSVLPNGDESYAKSLATQLSGHGEKEIITTELIIKFTDEYNFTDKRLPVWKVSYPFNHKERLYVETSTGVLAKNTNDAELIEGYSFALFHKHHYMDFAGKTARDISTMIGAGLQILMVIIGLVFYFRWRSRKSPGASGK